VQKPDPASLAALLPAADTVLNRLPKAVRIYCVGGAVRDHLLGLPKADRDFVVVGATIEAMISAGFTPVGKDFPVFLHPVSHDEYALARTERKSGKGYKGFTFNADPAVTLEEDLSRRDLTVNAMAVDALGQLVDPFGGWEDLQRQCFRHVGPAFLEDPVRLLRLARFAAKWPQFTIATDTQALCQQIVAAGEASALIAERVWQEVSKGLMECKPSRMLDVLSDSGAWAAMTQAPDISLVTRQALDQSAAQAAAIEVRFALLTNDNPPALLGCFKAPRQLTEIAGLLAASLQQLPELIPSLASISGAPPDAPPAAPPTNSAHLTVLLEWFERADLWRRPERLQLLLSAHRFRQDLTPNALRTLAALAAHLSAPAAHQRIAARVQAAQAAGSVISDVVREEKRLLIHSFSASPI
jgi:tRNA nucleotidyltransferase (CCA-adding enzyme)